MQFGLRTQTGIRLKHVTYQLEATLMQVADVDWMRRVIKEAVVNRDLHNMTCWAMQGSNAYAKLSIDIDYESHDRQVMIHGDGPLGAANIHYCVSRAVGGGDSSKETCRVWREAAEQFTQMAKEKGLHLQWTVVVSPGTSERYGLVMATDIVSCMGGRTLTPCRTRFFLS